MPDLPQQHKPRDKRLVRLVVAGPGSVLGRYPLGNKGGANVNALTPMPVPDDLRAMLDGTVTVFS